MRKFVLAIGLGVTLLVPTAAPALGVYLHEPHKGTSCADGEVGTWHFVNNQTGGADAGTLTAKFSSGKNTYPPSKVLRNVQHFIVVDEGPVLINAKTNLPGRLVLSDFSCREAKK